MKKTYPTSKKSREWAKHLRNWGKRLANRATRRIFKNKIRKAIEVNNGDN
jgi:hypothetical protein